VGQNLDPWTSVHGHWRACELVTPPKYFPILHTERARVHVRHRRISMDETQVKVTILLS